MMHSYLATMISFACVTGLSHRFQLSTDDIIINPIWIVSNVMHIIELKNIPCGSIQVACSTTCLYKQLESQNS